MFFFHFQIKISSYLKGVQYKQTKQWNACRHFNGTDSTDSCCHVWQGWECWITHVRHMMLSMLDKDDCSSSMTSQNLVSRQSSRVYGWPLSAFLWALSNLPKRSIGSSDGHCFSYCWAAEKLLRQKACWHDIRHVINSYEAGHHLEKRHHIKLKRYKLEDDFCAREGGETNRKKEIWIKERKYVVFISSP